MSSYHQKFTHIRTTEIQAEVKSNLFLLGGVQQVDPKEMGIQPTEVGNPTRGGTYCTCKETTYN